MQRLYPALVEATSVIGGVAIQGRASLGGNLCNSGPAADSIPAMIVLQRRARHRRARRPAHACRSRSSAPARAATCLRPGEFVVSIHFPSPAPDSGAAWQRFIPRNEMDIAVVNAGVHTCASMATTSPRRASRIGAVAPTPSARRDGRRRAGRQAADGRDDRGRGRSCAERRPRRSTTCAARSSSASTCRRCWSSARCAKAARASTRGLAKLERPHRRHMPRSTARSTEFLADQRDSLLEALRERLGLTGAKEGCNNGNCGACTVIMDGRLVNSCCVLAAEVEGASVTTVEGIAGEDGLHPLQQAFLEEAALQCGICTPGFLVVVEGAARPATRNPTEHEIRFWLAGNLCRCTGYDKIVRAVQTPPAGTHKIARSQTNGRHRRAGSSTRSSAPGRSATTAPTRSPAAPCTAPTSA